MSATKTDEYLFTLPIGDWSDDGHGHCNWYTCKANKPVERIREAHYKIHEATGINIHEICARYEEDSVGLDTFEMLNNLGFDEGYKEFSAEVLFDSDHMAHLWVFLLMKADPELRIEFCEDEEIPMLPFYGLDAHNRHIGQVGYGVFSG